MKVTQILALFGHSIGFGRGTAFPLPCSLEQNSPKAFIAAATQAGKSAQD
jgi:hypothetical protein